MTPFSYFDFISKRKMFVRLDFELVISLIKYIGSVFGT